MSDLHSETENSDNQDTSPLIPDPLVTVKDSENEPCQCIQARHVLAFLAFLGFFNVYCLRVNLSVALVAMVNTSSSQPNVSTHSDCKSSLNSSSSTVQSAGEFNWSEQTQGFILGAFFYGYITTQVPGGFMAERFGGKLLFGFGILCTSILTLLTPVVARWNLYAFYAVRILEGIGEGVTFPAMHAMWGNWAPVWERTRLAGFSYSGCPLGTVLAMPAAGLLCGSDFLGGWPSAFYVFGAAGCVWSLLWFCLVHETPADHPRISKAEREYIENSVGKRERLRTPWLKIFTSGALWAIAVASVANNWGTYTFLTCLPTFMKRILLFDIKSNGLLSALPYAAAWFIMTIAVFLADHLRTRNYLSTLNTRRLMASLGLLVPAMLLIGVSYVGCDHVWAVSLLTLAIGVNAFGSGGYSVNHLDIAPKFAGVLMGITNGLATIPGFMAPAIVDYITGNDETVAEWRIVFFMTAGIYVFGAVFYVILARGHEMSWAREKPKSDSVLSSDSGANIQTEDEAPPYNIEVDIPPPPAYTDI